PAVSTTAGPDRIRFTGQVRIAGSGLSLDTDPPKVNPDGTPDLILGLVEPPRIANGYMPDPRLVEWTGEGMPTRQQCADLVKKQAVSRLPVKVGTIVCVGTNE